jgi:hypothetical protein
MTDEGTFIKSLSNLGVFIISILHVSENELIPVTVVSIINTYMQDC